MVNCCQNYQPLRCAYCSRISQWQGKDLPCASQGCHLSHVTQDLPSGHMLAGRGSERLPSSALCNVFAMAIVCTHGTKIEIARHDDDPCNFAISAQTNAKQYR
jgi:hypothetical protein